MSFSNHSRRPTVPPPFPPRPHANFAETLRTFNTAIVASRAGEMRNFSKELQDLFNTPAFRCVLEAIQVLSEREGITERDAADQVIKAFRNIDRIWGEYLVQEGIDRLQQLQS